MSLVCLIPQETTEPDQVSVSAISEGHRFETTFNANDFEILPPLGHEGVSRTLYLKRELSCRDIDKGKLWLKLWQYVYEDGHIWAEGKIGNDPIREPLGLLKDVTLFITAGERLIFSKKAWGVPDQTGMTFLLGRPKFAPLRNVLDSLTQDFPPVVLSPQIIQKWSQVFVDNINTHIPSSPRNGLYPQLLSGYLAKPTSLSLCNAAIQWTHAQVGFWHPDQGWQFGRPMPPWNYQEDRPWEFDRVYGIDSKAEGRTSQIGEGWIKIPRYEGQSDSLGRYQLKELKESGAWSLEWSAVRGGQRDRKNGFDFEHYENRDIALSCILTPSRHSREVLRSVTNGMFSSTNTPSRGNHALDMPFYPNDVLHNSRSVGWSFLGLFWAWKGTGDDQYLQAFRKLFRVWWGREYRSAFGYEIGLEPDFPYAMTKERIYQYPNFDRQPTEPGAKMPIERAWQSGVIGAALALMRKHDPDKGMKALYSQAVIHIANIAKESWDDAEKAMFREIGLYRVTPEMTDDYLGYFSGIVHEVSSLADANALTVGLYDTVVIRSGDNFVAFKCQKVGKFPNSEPTETCRVVNGKLLGKGPMKTGTVVWTMSCLLDALDITKNRDRYGFAVEWLTWLRESSGRSIQEAYNEGGDAYHSWIIPFHSVYLEYK